MGRGVGVDFVLGFSTPPDSGSPGPSGSWSFGGVFSGYFRIMGRNGAGLLGWPPDMGLTGSGPRAILWSEEGSFGGVFSGCFRMMWRNGAGLAGWPPDMGLTGFVEGGLLREAVAVGAAGGVIDSE